MAVLRQRTTEAGIASLLLGLALAASGCSTGAYPLDIFPEMHYQQSFRAQEGPRLSPPAGSAPTESSYTGQVKQDLPVNLGTTLTNPLEKSQANLETGQRLFTVNCGPCHGGDGKGTGALVPYFKAAGPQVPVDLTGVRGTVWSEGQLYSIITNGQPPGYFQQPAAKMPPFGQLLTPDERWQIVMAVMKIQGR